MWSIPKSPFESETFPDTWLCVRVGSSSTLALSSLVTLWLCKIRWLLGYKGKMKQRSSFVLFLGQRLANVFWEGLDSKHCLVLLATYMVSVATIC